MSTRSIIVVTGKAKYHGHSTVRLYKHSDGYPTDNLRVINEALEVSIRQATEQAIRFSEPVNDLKINVGQMVGNLIGAATTVYGMGAHIDSGDDYEGEFETAFKPEQLGCQSDLEWIYVIDLDAKTVSVYGGGYTGKTPQVAFKKGTVNPIEYAEHLKAEYQDETRREIELLVRSIEAWSFKVNPVKPKRATKKAKKLEVVGA